MNEQADAIRVLHVAEAFATGVLQVLRALTEGLAEAGMSVGIAHGRRPETPADTASLLDPRVERFELPWVNRSPTAQARALTGIRQAVAAFRPDVVHLHSSFAGAVGSLAVPSRIPTVYSPHAYSFDTGERTSLKSGVLRLAESGVARRVSIIGAVSESEANIAREGAGAERVVVVPNGIPELDRPVPPLKAAPVGGWRRPEIVAMGRMDPQRLPGETAGILRRLSDVADPFWIGAAKPGTEGEQLVRGAGVPVSGWLDRDAALNRLSQAAIYLHWTAWDGHPISVLEAMARGVVVVARELPVTREMLPPEQVCTDASSAVDRCRQLLESADEWLAAREAQSAVAEQFGAARMIRQWIDVYRGLARGGGDSK